MSDERCRCKHKRMKNWIEVRCSRFAVKDGYCKQHHPDAKEARRQALADRIAEESRAANKRRSIEFAQMAVVSAAKEWLAAKERDGATADALALAVARLNELEAA
jgi:hypothetical protein